jgi:hypothetical protein
VPCICALSALLCIPPLYNRDAQRQRHALGEDAAGLPEAL